MKRIKEKILLLGLLLLIGLSLGVIVLKKITGVHEDIRKIAVAFYEDYFYPNTAQDDSTIAVLEAYGKTGIRVNLDAILKALELTDTETAKRVAGCDLQKTKVTIYPESPYSQKNYRLVIDAICE